MNEMKFDWDDLRLFLAVAQHGGLAAASHATGKSAPTLGRRMLHLEIVLGRELFRRHARGYELTEDGTLFLERIKDVEAKIVPLATSAEKDRKTLVKISAGTWMTLALMQDIAAIMDGNDRTQLRFISDEHILDIGHREAMIGIRNRRPEQIGLACRKVGRVQFAGYAASKHVKPWAKVIGNTPSALWLNQSVEDAERIEVTAPRNALDMAKTGICRAVLPTFIGDQESDLVRVTAPILELAHDQWLVTHNEERFIPEVRVTIERIAELLKKLHMRSGADA
ncbi:LysR family transcriptional regulator [Nisaea sp.]|uniref:LysR family transcriptional regulator n=2 Tax=Nisaea sp. TaxID=2024842 RepID=UPI003296A732